MESCHVYILKRLTLSTRPWPNRRILALCVVGRSSIPGRVISKTCKMVHAISLLSIQHFGKVHGSETGSVTRWPKVALHLPPTVAFTVLAWPCGLKANETEMGDALFTKNGEGRNFDSDINKTNSDSDKHLKCAKFND